MSSSSAAGSVVPGMPCLCACGSSFANTQEHAVHLRTKHRSALASMSMVDFIAAGLYRCMHPGCIFVATVKAMPRHAKKHLPAPSSTVRTAGFIASPRRTRARSAAPVRALSTLGHRDLSPADPALLASRQAAARKRRGKPVVPSLPGSPVPSPVHGSPVPRAASPAGVAVSSLSSLFLPDSPARVPGRDTKRPYDKLRTRASLPDAAPLDTPLSSSPVLDRAPTPLLFPDVTDSPRSACTAGSAALPASAESSARSASIDSKHTEPELAEAKRGAAAVPTSILKVPFVPRPCPLPVVHPAAPAVAAPVVPAPVAPAPFLSTFPERLDAVPVSLRESYPTWRTIPERLKVPFIACVRPFAVRLLAHSAARDDAEFDHGLIELLEILPKLLRQDRKGARGSNELRRRLSNFAAGKPLLYRDRAVPSARSAAEQARARALRVTDMVRRGHLRKALDILNQTQAVDVLDPLVIPRLHEVHATPREVALPDLPADMPILPMVSAAQFLEAAKKSANGAAPGPSGIDCDVVLVLISEDTCLAALTEVANRILRGQVGDVASKFLLSRTLVPVRKPDGDLRPISIGDSVFKIASNAALSLIPSELLASVFGETQYAYGRPGGSELAVHTVRTAIPASDGSIVLCIDVKTAFPRIRVAQVQAALLADPRTAYLAPLFNWAHRSPKDLLVYSKGKLVEVVQQSEGVCQGDVTGSFNFCKAIAPILQKVQELVPLVKIVADADDVTIVGPPEEVFRAFDALAEEFDANGMIIQLNKSFCLWPRTTGVPRSIAEAAGDRSLPIKEAAAKLLGAFIGDDLAAHKLFVMEQLESSVDTLHALSHPSIPAQVALLLLRSCLLPRSNYVLRVSPPTATQEAASLLDQRILEFCTYKLNLPVPLPADAVDQLHMPISMGGVGVRPLSRSVSPAYLASYLQICADQADAPTPTEGSDVLTDLQGCLDDIHGSYPEVFAHMLPVDALLLCQELNPDNAPKHLQSTLVKRMEVEIRRKAESTADTQTKARLYSASARGAGLWLSVVPTCAAFSMVDLLFCICLRYLLGLPVADDLPYACCCLLMRTYVAVVHAWILPTTFCTATAPPRRGTTATTRLFIWFALCSKLPVFPAALSLCCDLVNPTCVVIFCHPSKRITVVLLLMLLSLVSPLPVMLLLLRSLWVLLPQRRTRKLPSMLPLTSTSCGRLFWSPLVPWDLKLQCWCRLWLA